MLYSILRLKRFNETRLPYEINKFTLKELEMCFKNELTLNNTAELCFIEEKVRYKMRSTLERISFKIDQIKYSIDNKYNIKDLTDKDNDYKFVLGI